MIDKIVGILERLFPPLDDDPRKLLLWRSILVVVTIMNAFVLAIHIALACGLLPWYAGFAEAADVKRQYAEITAIRELQLEDAIQRTRERNCKAMQDGNREARAISADRLRAHMRSYRILTGREYQLFDCNAL